MTELDYLEEIYQELMEIQEDTNSINGELGFYAQEIIYDTSGDKFLTEIIERQNENLQLTMINVLVTVLLLIYIFFVRVLKW